MEFDERLRDLSEQLRATLRDVSADRAVGNDDLRSFLGFFSKVVEVVEQAFRDVYRVLIDLKYVGNAVGPQRWLDLRKRLDMLLMRDRYRDAEQICTRLHFLSEQYQQEIAPKFPYLVYGEMLSLLDEYEGRIITLVHSAVFELQGMLAQEPDPASLHALAVAATRKAEDVHRSLAELHAVQNHILGLSGRVGLLELLGAEPTAEQRRVIIEEVLMGDRYEISGQVGAVGPHAQATGNTFTQIRYDAAASIDPNALRAALSDLYGAIGEAGLPRDRAISAQTAVGTALENGVQGAEVKPDAVVPNIEKVGNILKQANVVAQQGSSLWDSVRTLAPIVGPLVGGAHVVASWFGVPVP